MDTRNYVYILANNINATTYVGYTNNPTRRIRQHNGDLVGGARFTAIQRSKHPSLQWHYLCLVTSINEQGHVAFDKCTALSLEWHVKYQTRKNKLKGPDGRMAALQAALASTKFVDIASLLACKEAI